MLPGMEFLSCQHLDVPMDVMQHVVKVESSFNPYAIGVVGGRLVRQPANLAEALSTARMLEGKGYNFSLGLAQVNRYNLARYGLASYEDAFQECPNLRAGARILAECHARANGDWGKSLSCYYSGNEVTGFRHGYVQKVFASMRAAGSVIPDAVSLPAIDKPLRKPGPQPMAAMPGVAAAEGGFPAPAIPPPVISSPPVVANEIIAGDGAFVF